MDTQRAARIRKEVARAAANAENLTLEELKCVFAEAKEFIRTLPEEERGAFYWKCRGLECLSVLIPALEEDA